MNFLSRMNKIGILFKVSTIVVVSILWFSPSYGWFSAFGGGNSTHFRLSTESTAILLDPNEYPDLIKYRQDIINATTTIDNDTSAHDGVIANNDGPGERWWRNALLNYNNLNFNGNPNSAYWFIGQMLHLVQDMGVPAHAFDIPHFSENYNPFVENWDWLEWLSSGDDYTTDNIVTPEESSFTSPDGYRGGLRGDTIDIVNNDKIPTPPGRHWREYWINGAYGNNNDTFSLNSVEEQDFRSRCLENARNYGAGALQLASKKLPPIITNCKFSNNPCSSQKNIPTINSKESHKITFTILENRKKSVKIFMTLDSEDGKPIINKEYGTGKTIELKNGNSLPWEGDYFETWKGEMADGLYPANGEHMLFIRVEDEDGNESASIFKQVKIDIPSSSVLITPAFRDVAAASGIAVFNVTNNRADAVEWTSSENENWLSVSPVYGGAGDGTVTVRYDANSGDARIGTITFSVNGTKVQKVEVRQAGASVPSVCSSDGVAEAISGFTWPLPYNFSNNGGYSFKDEAYETGMLIYHPGEDWNVPDKPGGSCDGDLRLNVVAVADGKVVYANPDSWGGVVILHNYQNNIWYSQYGHIQNIKVSTKEPKNTVKKGDVIAEIGKKGDYANCAHLHFEIRKFNHHDPCNGGFWSTKEDNFLGKINNVLSWYESPKEFISANQYRAISIETLGDRKDGNLKIVSLQPNGRTAGFGSSGRVVINGISVTSSWSNDGIRLNNIYSAIGLRWDDLLAPLHFEIFDKKGNKIADTYYPFNDIGHAEDACSESWYRRPVMKLWKEGIVSGYTDGNRGRFGSGNATSRAELVKMVVGAANAGNLPKEVTVAPFADVPADTWYAKYIAYAKEKGWVQGCDTDKNLFCPNDSINRADAAKIISKALQPQLLEEVKSGRKPDKIFPDVTDSGEWYYPYVYTLQAAHAVQGFSDDGTFRPHETTNRAQLAKMVCVAKFGEIECTCMDAK